MAPGREVQAMTAMPDDSNVSTLERALAGVQLVVGVGLLAYGVGRLTDTVTYELPAAGYFLASIVMFAYAALLVRR